MHIKQVLIRNFRSYKDQSEFTPFSPKNNVVGALPTRTTSLTPPLVGRNGSGKSNFFHGTGAVPPPAHAAQPSSSCSATSTPICAPRRSRRSSTCALSAQPRRPSLTPAQEGASGETVMQAYVEIVFDNRDGRIPVRGGRPGGGRGVGRA